MKSIKQSIRSWLKEEKGGSGGSTSIDIPPNSFLAYALGGGGRVGASQAMEFYRTNSSIATAVDLTADAVKELNPVLKNIKTGETNSDHPILKLLRAPNPFQTQDQFLEHLAKNLLLPGNGYPIATGKATRPPLELYAAKPQNVSVIPDPHDDFPGSFRISKGTASGNYVRHIKYGQPVKYLSDKGTNDMYHLSRFSSRADNLQGDSPLEAIALEIRQQILGRNHNLSLLNNGGRLSLVVAFKEENPGSISDEEHERRKQKINEQLSGTNNAGRVAVISDAEVSMKEFGKSNRDMDYAKLDTIAGMSIYLRYKIPLPMITLDASTYNNFATAIEHFYDTAVLPVANNIFAGLSNFLLPRYGIDPTEWTISYDKDSVRVLMARQVETLIKRKELGIETANELRGFLPNRGDIENGDNLLVLQQNIPLDMINDYWESMMKDGEKPKEPTE